MTVDYVTISNLIIDDIVFPDGQTSMNVLGGAGLHAVVGMRTWSESVGYAATVGSDLDENHVKALHAFGADVEGLILRDEYQTARAWQVFEQNGYRHEIFRTDLDTFNERKVQFEDLPESYLGSKGYHIQWGTLTEFGNLIGKLRTTNPNCQLVMEIVPTEPEDTISDWQQILSQLSLFAPDREEATGITGDTDTLRNCRTFIEWGAPLVSMRMGAEGSLLMERTGRCWKLPAVPTNIVDVTGAGNAYCGGFTVGLGEGLDPLEAALQAVVSASFALEQLGIPAWDDSHQAEAKKRLEWARQRVEAVVNPV